MLTYLNWIFGLDISVKLVMLDVSLPELNYATTYQQSVQMKHWVLEADQMSRLQLCSSIFVRFNLWLQRAAVQQWAGQQVNIYRICLCPFSAIVWGVGVRCWKPIIGTHTFRETLRPRACACNVPRGSPVETTGDNCGDSNEWLNWLGWGGAGTRRAWLWCEVFRAEWI